ncbi:Uncharacterised protein [Vibrio cholerae]|nr:Uncharacterised protein [Vibrio cholerae]
MDYSAPYAQSLAAVFVRLTIECHYDQFGSLTLGRVW